MARRIKYKRRVIRAYDPWEWGKLYGVLSSSGLTPRQVLKALVMYLGTISRLYKRAGKDDRILGRALIQLKRLDVSLSKGDKIRVVYIRR